MKKETCCRLAATAMLFLTLVPAVMPQMPATNLAKYWYYRNRLDYFVVPGDRPGESQIACTRNKLFEEDSDQNLDYGQHGIYTGFYWSVLATEYYLLKSYGQESSASATLSELQFALEAYVEEMDECEYYWGLSPAFDGFFIRENVPCNFMDPSAPEGKTSDGRRHLDLLNKRLTPDNHYLISEVCFNGLPKGHPGYAWYRTCCDGTQGGTPMGPPDHQHPEPMSQDEAIGLMTGLALTIRLTEETSCHDMAVSIADKLVRYLLNLDELYGCTDFRIYEPDGSVVEESRGGNTYYLAKGLIMAGEAMTGQSDYGGVNFIQNSVWSANSWWAWDCSLSKMAAMLAAIGDSWTWTDEGLTNITAHYNWDTFYLLLWEVLHQKTMGQQEQHNLLQKTMDQLNNGPCEGTYSYASRYDHSGNLTGTAGVYSGGGWGSSYKWCKEQIYQDGGDWWLANFNGLDFMILYNLYHIVQMGSPNTPPYINYKNLVLSGPLPLVLNHPSGGSSIIGTDQAPLCLVGFNSIVSDQTINVLTAPEAYPGPGNITYKSEMSVRLLPGFRAVKGCYFHALTCDLDCTSGTYRSGTYPEGIIDTLYDLYRSSLPYPYPLEVNQGRPEIASYPLLPGEAGFPENSQGMWCYPNPCAQHITLAGEKQETSPAIFEIRDAFGRMIRTFTDDNSASPVFSLLLDVSDLNAGNYNICLISGTGRRCLTFTKTGSP